MKNFYLSLLIVVSLFSNVTNAQTPVLNSYPSAAATVFLDFDGHTVSGTSWNIGGPIECASANLTSAQISEVYSRVAEDYRPFNINVTTDSTKFWSAPIRQRMRVIITISHSWYGNGAGGIAYLNSFTSGDNTPTFVFSALLNYNAKNIAEAASHEVGHTLGLRHQATYDAACSKLSEYNSGIGSGETAWAPIMGVGYYRNFTVWHNGPNPNGCTNTQNELAMISGTTNGFGFRVDDHAAISRDATVATFSNNKFNVDGIISKTDDIDMFKFTLSKQGKFNLSAVPYNVGSGNIGSNLDLQIDLLDGQQRLLGSYNPGTELSSIVDTVLSSGTYYFRVDGLGNQFATEYGSLGSYSLQGTFTDMGALPLHKLELKGITDNGKHKLNWEVVADEAIIKQVVEVSENGRTYRSLTEVANDSRTYQYAPTTTTALQYRLNITFNNGKQYFSNVIALRANGGSTKPQLFNTLIRNHSLMINTPFNCNYTIVDFNGREILSGNALKGSSSVNISILSQGSYIIRFTNGQEQFIEKFLKQ
jgi:hypothetical protein